MKARRVAGAAIAVAVMAAVGGCSTADPRANGLPDAAGGDALLATVLLDAEVMPLLAPVPHRSVVLPPSMRLAAELVPPTNRWFSGLVFGAESQPVFPLPLSFRLIDGGFAFGVPTVTTTANLIAAPLAEHVAVTTSATDAVVTAYDEVSVTITLRDEEAALATVTIAPGSPMVGYRAVTAHDLSLDVPFRALSPDEGVWTVTVGEQVYGLVAPEGELDDAGRRLRLPEGAMANWIAVPPDGELRDLLPFAGSPLVGVDVLGAVSEGTASTTVRYRTADGSPTLVGTLAVQGDPRSVPGASCGLGTYETVSGPMSLCGATALTVSVPAEAPVDPADLAALDLSGLDDDERAELVTVLVGEAAVLPALPADTYFGGKALARIATMLSLARALDEPELADALHRRLLTELRTWVEPDGCNQRADRCFVYDPAVRGMVGLVPSFGSEQFNDHHFHYGSFLYAAAVAADGDAALVAELRPMMSLLAADIASSGGTAFPTRRAFDAYAGHSWASGYSPFGDGNNQESSSEAVAAHHAIALWGAVAGDAGLEQSGRWMLARESHSALKLATSFDPTAAPYLGYEHGVVGIVWDGKRDYATWFSPEPAAILGIQLLPMRPGTASSLAGDDDRIRSNLAEATAGGPALQFADYLLMYAALAGPDDAVRALDAARSLPASRIDDGNSRSYLLAFIMVQR